MIRKRFHAVLICDDAECGEIVHVAGDTEAVQELDEEYGWYTDHKLRPQAFFPAPPMFSLPGGTPKAVEVEIESSFAIAWQDQNSAANRLRVSVERIMDDLGVPEEDKTKSGKPFRLDLNARIQWFEKSSGQKKEHVDTFQALRRVGNMGSHGSLLEWDDLLAALTVYEEALEDLYGDKHQLIAKAKAHLLKLTAKA